MGAGWPAHWSRPLVGGLARTAGGYGRRGWPSDLVEPGWRWAASARFALRQGEETWGEACGTVLSICTILEFGILISRGTFCIALRLQIFVCIRAGVANPWSKIHRKK